MMGDVVRNDTATLEQSYLECERIAKDSSSSFLRAFKTLPKPKETVSKPSMPFVEEPMMWLTETGYQIFLHSLLNRWVHFD